MRFASTCILLSGLISPACYAKKNPKIPQPPLANKPLLENIRQSSASIDQKFAKCTAKYLTRLSRIESKLKEASRQKGSTANDRLATGDYQQWVQKMQDTSIHSAPRLYISRLDSLRTALGYLQQSRGSFSGTGINGDQLSQTSAQVQLLQAHLDMSSDIHQYIDQRRQQIAQLLSQYTSVPGDMAREFDKFKATAYYYRQEVEQYKALAAHPRQMEGKALAALNKVPAFQQFMAQHSMLAQLF